MQNKARTVTIAGASQGIGAGLVKTFLESSCSVVANARNMTQSSAFQPSDKLALVDGDIAKSATAANIAKTAVAKFRSIDALVNNAGIFLTSGCNQFSSGLELTVEDCDAGILFRVGVYGRQELNQVTKN
jgi:NADP-dependent 3-hydroxy acid dehydrogenase YdfG